MRFSSDTMHHIIEHDRENPVRLDLQSSRSEYQHFQCANPSSPALYLLYFSHYKCLYSQQSDYKSD